MKIYLISKIKSSINNFNLNQRITLMHNKMIINQIKIIKIIKMIKYQIMTIKKIIYNFNNYLIIMMKFFNQMIQIKNKKYKLKTIFQEY